MTTRSMMTSNGAGGPVRSGGDAGATSPFVRTARAVERTTALDSVDRAVRPVAAALIRNPTARSILHGHWLGHAVHPLLTDLPIGMWTSASVLDLVGGKGSAPSARRLVGAGLLAALPTAVTGAAEWGAVDAQRDRRTGLVHAAANTVALGFYAASWRARGRGAQTRGAGLALAGALATGVGGFFGGHLIEARKVSSRNPAFEND
jgi:uncharacterized membrane protein